MIDSGDQVCIGGRGREREREKGASAVIYDIYIYIYTPTPRALLHRMQYIERPLLC
jgi:hypothetical protein